MRAFEPDYVGHGAEGLGGPDVQLLESTVQLLD